MGKAQHPTRGRILIGLGWVLGVLGWIVLFGVNFVMKSFLPARIGLPPVQPIWLGPLILMSIQMAGGLLYACSRPLRTRGKQHRAPVVTSFDQLAGTRYVLYLRPFALDARLAWSPPSVPPWLFRSPLELAGLTLEEVLILQFAQLGHVIAIGRPGERLPVLGATRGYVPAGDWQNTVSTLVGGAHVVLIWAVPGHGTVWEFTEALRMMAATRLVLMVSREPADYDEFRVAVAEEYARRSAEHAGWPALPQLPELPPRVPDRKGRTWDFPLTGFLTFDEAWRASFTRFDPAIRHRRWVRTMRRLVQPELAPVLDPLSRLPER